MPDLPRLTVALPSCNGGRHLREAMEGILAQADDFDLVVSDDRSDDDTLAIVREMAGDRARVSVNAERLGLAGNWNRCVALSRTPWVAIFHQDDVMGPGHLADHRAAIDRDPAAGLVASASTVIDDRGIDVPELVVGRGGCGPSDRAYPAGAFVAELAVENPLRCSAVTINAEAHAEVGGFDPTYRYVVDWDYWLRVARIRPVVWLARPTVAVRWHPSSETHTFKTGTTDLDETIRLLDELHRADASRLSDPKGMRKRADRRLARAFLNRAHVALKAGNSRLARDCLGRSVRQSPAILGTIALDPRLAAQMATLALTPDRASRWFRRPSSGK